ncbi:ABC transporter permease [Halovibrio salipaludis]|uniref:ABC transporter permease n=1 Tax=Halovibrio salipaludis TaxID=2032626 RepID=A0A2A2F5V8_9GAMM|nr:MlaD family protein [Halovibrio salipaludis]PAU80019.1 ABC transporter permease [Halovibrio salipaludis]
METRAHHILIGLFAILMLAGALLFGWWLSEGGLHQKQAEYRIIFNEAVSGLTVGSNVKYNGITVGQVTELELDPRDPRRVLSRIAVDPSTPVKQNTHAQIQPTGLLSGTAHIRLSGGTPNSLALVSEPGTTPEIPARPSPFSQLREQSGDILANINQLVQRMESLLSRRNLENIDQTLDGMAELTRNLNNQQERISRTLETWNRTGQQAQTTLSEARGLITDTRAILEKDAPQALADTAEAARATRRAVTEVEALVNGNREALEKAMQGSASLGPTLEEMRRTLGALRDLSQRLESDAAGTLFNRDKLEEYQP